MTGDGERDGFNPKALDRQDEANDADDAFDDGDLARLEGEMSPLLHAVGAFAREEEAEIDTYAANTSHALSDVARQSAVQRILELQARERAARTDPGGGTPRSGAAITLVRTVPRRSRLKGALIGLGSGFAVVAVALALWMHPTQQDPSLPPYSIAARGGIREARGALPDGADDAREGRVSTEEQRLGADSVLIVAARPETAVTGTVAARAFFIQGGEAMEIAPNAQVAPTGAIELRFQGAELIGSRHGAASLRVIVGRPGALQSLSVQAAAQATGTRWRVLTVPLDLGPG